MLDIIHTLLATYAASEWLYAPTARKKATVKYSLSFLVLLKLLETMLGLGAYLPRLGPWIKVPLIAVTFVTTLYVDCAITGSNDWAAAIQQLLRTPFANPNVDARAFLISLRQATLALLPVCPFISVIISFFFFIAVSIMEFVSIDPQFLNWPIYYGTIYGPFSFVYIRVKRSMAGKALLPQSGGHVLGGGVASGSGSAMRPWEIPLPNPEGNSLYR